MLGMKGGATLVQVNLLCKMVQDNLNKWKKVDTTMTCLL